MRKVLGAVLALMLLLVASWILSRWLTVRRVNAELIEELTTAWNAREPRTGSTHENGFACAASLLEEKVDFRSVTPAMVDAIAHELPPEITRVRPWAERFRACADSKELRIVPGVVPITAWPAAKNSSAAIYMLEKVTRAELKASSDPEAAARLCLGTLEVEVDRSFLGFRTALGMSLAVEKLAAPCARAVQGLSPEARAILAPRFAALSSRMLSNSRMYQRDWLFRTVSSRYSVMTDEQRARVPAELVPQRAESFLGAMVFAGGWSEQDAAVRNFVGVADTRGPARVAAAEAVEKAERFNLPLLRYHGERTLSQECDQLDLARALLGVLGKLALGEDPGIPPQMTRTAEGLEFENAERRKMVVQFGGF